MLAGGPGAPVLGHVAHHGELVGHHVEDGLEAARAQQPDLILLDQCTLETRGLEALSALGRDPLTSQIPVIMLASRPHAAAKIRALWHGARDYLSKPVDAGALADAVGVALDYPARSHSVAV